MSGISFFEELNNIVNTDYQAQDNTQDETNETNEEICLIDFTPLTENSVKLNCGHSFNYGPLYRDVIEKKRNCRQQAKDDPTIQCPFCRRIHEGLLPVVPGYDLVDNVNKKPDNIQVRNVQCTHSYMSSMFSMYNKQYTNTYTQKEQENGRSKLNKCSYILKRGPRKGQPCNKMQKNHFCCEHIKHKNYFCCGIIKTGKNAGEYCTVPVFNNGDYCSLHMSQKK